jgi:hypothetical protein
VRIFLIVLVSIGVRIAREFSSESVHKATNLLLVNYLLYGTILLCTVAMSKVAFGLAIFLQLAVVTLDTVAGTLALVSTLRCVNAQQAVCIHTLPGSIVTVVLTGLLWLLDTLQCWSIYKVLRLPSFTSYLGRRLRVLFSWALPFVVLNTVSLLVEGKWTMFVTPHMVVDPLIIVMAPTLNATTLAVILAAVIATDGIALYMVAVSLVRISIGVQISISAFAFILVLASTGKTSREAVEKESPMLAAEATTTLRQRKSKQKIAF